MTPDTLKKIKEVAEDISTQASIAIDYEGMADHKEETELRIHELFDQLETLMIDEPDEKHISRNGD